MLNFGVAKMHLRRREFIQLREIQTYKKPLCRLQSVIYIYLFIMRHSYLCKLNLYENKNAKWHTRNVEYSSHATILTNKLYFEEDEYVFDWYNYFRRIIILFGLIPVCQMISQRVWSWDPSSVAESIQRNHILKSPLNQSCTFRRIKYTYWNMSLSWIHGN